MPSPALPGPTPAQPSPRTCSFSFSSAVLPARWRSAASASWNTLYRLWSLRQYRAVQRYPGGGHRQLTDSSTRPTLLPRGQLIGYAQPRPCIIRPSAPCSNQHIY